MGWGCLEASTHQNIQNSCVSCYLAFCAHHTLLMSFQGLKQKGLLNPVKSYQSLGTTNTDRKRHLEHCFFTLIDSKHCRSALSASLLLL